MRFRLADEQRWESVFEAASADDLIRGIASAWDARIEAVRRTPGATHPAFALPIRLAEVDRWLAERLARSDVTVEQRRSWEAQAWHWRYTANAELGGDEATSALRLHVWAPASREWAIPAERGPSGRWRCATRAPRVARVVSAERAVALWEGADVIAAYALALSGLCDGLTDAIRVAQFPLPRLVASSGDAGEER